MKSKTPSSQNNMTVSTEEKKYTEFTIKLRTDEVKAILKLTKYLSDDVALATGISKDEYLMICEFHNKLFIAR